MRQLAMLSVLFGCLFFAACSTPGTYLAQPQAVPELSAPNQFGTNVALREATSGPWAVVFFYPEADTPG